MMDELAYQSLIIGMWNYFFYPYPCQIDPDADPWLVFHFLVIASVWACAVIDRNPVNQALYHLSCRLQMFSSEKSEKFIN